jgi:hypothetical protein
MNERPAVSGTLFGGTLIVLDNLTSQALPSSNYAGDFLMAGGLVCYSLAQIKDWDRRFMAGVAFASLVSGSVAYVEQGQKEIPAKVSTEAPNIPTHAAKVSAGNTIKI